MMTKGTLTKLAVSSLALALAAVSCKPGTGAHASSAGSTAAPGAGKLAQSFAQEGERAVAAGDAVPGAAFFERAVAFDRKNADYRVELGRAYVLTGRFASAIEAFQDARTLGHEDGSLLISLALAQAASGDLVAARTTLGEAQGRTTDADRGLALALAGDLANAVVMLDAAARAPGADATVRQNLALAYALSGRWAEARTAAAQDVGADQLDARIAQWATLASTDSARARIAGLFHIPLVQADPGMPDMLALEGHPYAPVRMAAADPVAAPASAPSAADVPVAPVVDPVAADAAPAVAMATPDPEPTAVPAPLVVPAEPEAASPAPVHFTTPRPAAKRAPVAPLLRASPRPAKIRLAAWTLHAAPVPQGRGRWVVQLGAFSAPATVETAWTRTRAQVGLLANYTPSGGIVSRGAIALHRLSLAGFSTRPDAVRVCAWIRRSQGDCFVRPQANDAPVEWVARDAKTQVAVAARPAKVQLAAR